MRFHVPPVPFSQATREFDHCGHTQLLRHFTEMMTLRGHEVLLYAGDDCDVPCAEHVNVLEREDQQQWAKDAKEHVQQRWDAGQEWWDVTNKRAIKAIEQRAEPGDYLCNTTGYSQLPIATALPQLRHLEYGVGYVGITPDSYKAWCSHAHRHYVQGHNHDLGGHWFDAVINHPFDVTDYHSETERGEYLLYMGRVVGDKGVRAAVDIAKAVGREIVVAGPGYAELVPEADYRGQVTLKEKAELLAKAYAVLMPSLYVEPFGMVAVEALLSGAPVYTTDWGAFPEFVPRQFRCHNLAEFVNAVERTDFIERDSLVAYARRRFSFEAIGPQYEEWLARVATVFGGGGWYARKP